MEMGKDEYLWFQNFGLNSTSFQCNGRKIFMKRFA